MAFDTRVTEGDPDRVAVILPGRNYTADMPLLWYARTVLSFQGWTVHAIDWPSDVSIADVPDLAASAIDQAGKKHRQETRSESAQQNDDLTCLVVGKSLGSLALPHAVQRGLPGIWLTPLLFEPSITAAATNLGAEHMLIGGTADRSSWDRDLARHSGAQLLEIPDADHTLQVTGNLDHTLGALERVVDAINAFAFEITQPIDSRQP